MTFGSSHAKSLWRGTAKTQSLNSASTPCTPTRRHADTFPPTPIRHRISKRLAIVATLRMRFQIQDPDDVGSSHETNSLCRGNAKIQTLNSARTPAPTAAPASTPPRQPSPLPRRTSPNAELACDGISH